MKKLIAVMSLALLCGTTLHADIAIVGKKEMVQLSGLIALVDIQELVSTDKTKLYVDLIANGQVAKVLKGNVKGKINFRIPRFFPCAAFDVSTGRHLAFLKKNDKNEYVCTNWYMSCLYLGGKSTKWFDIKGMVVDDQFPKDVIKDTEALIKIFPNKGMKSDQ